LDHYGLADQMSAKMPLFVGLKAAAVSETPGSSTSLCGSRPVSGRTNQRHPGAVQLVHVVCTVRHVGQGKSTPPAEHN
jgi:hypothetical protein